MTASLKASRSLLGGDSAPRLRTAKLACRVLESNDDLRLDGLRTNRHKANWCKLFSPMLATGKSVLSRPFIRYPLALAAVVVALLWRLAVERQFGVGLPTYITFYPAVMVVAVLAGLWPGMLATLLSALVVDYWILPPQGQFHIERPIDVIGLAIFLLMGVLISVLAESYRRNRQEALHSSEAKMQSIVSSAMDAIISVDEQQRIVVFNRAAENIFQCAASEAIGSSLARFIPPENRETHLEHVREFGTAGVTTRSMLSPGVLQAMRSNGETFPIEATISQVQSSGEKLYTVILRDITERKRTEAALLRSEKLASAGRMAASIAHEVNNPLEAVTNLLYLTKMASNLPEPARQYIDMADEELKRVAHITRMSLGFYRESNAPALTSVNAVLESALELLTKKVGSKRAVVLKEWDGDVQAMAVAGELRQVFSNLLSNSLDAIEEQGTITLRVSACTAFKNGCRCIRGTVADNGKGIDAALRQQMFEPFYTTKGTTGTGLGLWVSKQIIEKHGGSIRMRSSTNHSRRGTIFSIVIPVDAEQAGHAAGGARTT